MVQPQSLPLDCLPLELPLDAALSGAELRRIEPVQRELLRPLEYETVDEWRGAVNRALVAAVGGDSAMFQLEVPGLTHHYSEDLRPEPLSRYAELMPDLARTRRIYRRALRLGAGNRFILWKDHLEWLYGSGYFNEVVVKLRAFDTLWASASDGESEYPAMLHVYHDRRHGGRRFGAAEVQMMRVVQPALEAGVRTVRRLHASRSTLGSAVDRLGTAVFVFTLDGRLIHRNPRASALVEAAGGEALSGAAAELARGFGPAGSRVDGGSIRRRVDMHPGRYDLDASYLSPGVLHPSGAVLVTVADPSGRLPTKTRIRKRFGLTHRQAEVALLLAQRLSNREIAERLVISPHTALRHTEAVKAKLGVGDRRRVAERLRQPEGG